MGLSKLGRYDIVRVLGRGAMGTVYEARDPNLDRRVAIKTIAVHGLSPEGAADYEARFRVEARSAARLQHPNIVSVYDSGRDGETAYLVMEYVEGQDLKHHLDRGITYTLDQTLRIMRDLLAALAYAHAQNVVHRDVKPANLLIEADGRVKLTDFGVARIQDSGDATLTRGGMVGTLKYMSPEQVQGQPVDARSDLFAAGVVLYQLLTARQPFAGDGEFALIAQIVGVDPPAPSTLQPALPEAIDAVLACALAKSREQRYPRAQAFYEALVQACDTVQDLSTAPAPLAMASGPGASDARSGSAGFGGTGTTPTTSTVTQELELVYWKDVRDSDDALDLQGFLDRFPDGIYADLARRRLRKLGVVFLGEQTVTRVEPRSADTPAPAVPHGGHRRARPGRAHPVQPVPPGMRRHARCIAGRWLASWCWSSPPSPRCGWRAATSAPRSRRPARRWRPRWPLRPSRRLLTRSAGDAAPRAPAVAALRRRIGGGRHRQATARGRRCRRRQYESSGRPRGGPAQARCGQAARRWRTRRHRLTRHRPTGTAIEWPCVRRRMRGLRTIQARRRHAPARVLLGYQICLSEQCAKPMYFNLPLCEQRRAADLARRQQQMNRN